MTQNATTTDRYISFEGIDCEQRVERIVAQIRHWIAENNQPSPLHRYCETKLDEIAQRGQDRLYFIGSQVNVLRELFAQHDDRDALDLLEQIEEECC